MSILDIDNNIYNNTSLIMNWLKNNVINFGDYNPDDIKIVNNVINIKCSVFIRKHIGDFPDYIKFGRIDGHFNCDSCDLTTLRGTPDYIQGNFNCAFNNLKDFKEGPKYIGDMYYAEFNKLESLQGLPKKVNRLYLNTCPFLLTLEDLKYIKISSLFVKNCKQVSGAKYINHIDKIFIQDAETLEHELLQMNKKYNNIRKRIKRNYKILENCLNVII